PATAVGIRRQLRSAVRAWKKIRRQCKQVRRRCSWRLELSTIFTYYSGRPFYPTIDSYPGKPYTGPNNVPDKGTGSPYAANQNRAHWIVGETSAQLLAV